ncbi:choice-of-anchor N protein [Geomonas ferrireducens]|jgi:hypothetical protein|uniref:choice-of-anchor N protein n=1 Tax=Geomonas ferrireducens TaxID=2570227 RepID=UPI0010A86B1E|nr:choice-of-anchor N protein [Geomonas ferrireducens]
MRKLILAAAAALMFSTSAFAEPVLQLYIPGATYDSTETWVTTSSSFTLWVLGWGNKEPITNVFLSAAFKTGETGTITLTPTTAAPPVIDPSTPSAPTVGPSGVGTQPVLGDGSLLPSHGIYGDGTSWVSFGLGDFTLTDSMIGDFSVVAPDLSTLSTPGQINAYTVDITGYASGVHFDAYDHILSGNHVSYLFAPFSHDAEGGGNPPVPEPGTIVLLGAGFLGLAIYGKRRQRS